MKTIATYAADGSRLRDYPLSSIEYLLAKDAITVRRNVRGEIRKAFFRPTLNTSALLKTAHLGQSYSYEQLLPSGHHAWKHREFITPEQVLELENEGIEATDVERFIQQTFCAVKLSVLARSTKLPANVVAIDAFPEKRAAVRKLGRKKLTGRIVRPIEFDSQRRAA